MAVPRSRLMSKILSVVFLSIIVLSLHPQLCRSSSMDAQKKAENPSSSTMDAHNQANQSTNDSYINSTNSDYEGFVANTEREVPTGPDPLHNHREDQT